VNQQQKMQSDGRQIIAGVAATHTRTQFWCQISLGGLFTIGAVLDRARRELGGAKLAGATWIKWMNYRIAQSSPAEHIKNKTFWPGALLGQGHEAQV
jgi:hypothetical protein